MKKKLNSENCFHIFFLGHFIYTIGQCARIPGFPHKMFVTDKNPDTNEIFVVSLATSFHLFL